MIGVKNRRFLSAFDGFGRGLGRITLHTDNFTLEEVNILREVLSSKYNIKSSLKKVNNANPERGYAIRIAAVSLNTLRDMCSPHMYSSLIYKLAL